jgi:hypothetical protein
VLNILVGKIGRRYRSTLEDNMKMNLKELEFDDVDGFICLRIETSGGLL